MSILRNKLISIRSDFRDEGTETNFTIHLENHQNQFNGTHLAYVKRATIPHSWYNIPANTSIRVFEIGFGAQVVPFPKGSYTYAQFGNELQTILNAVATSNGSGKTYTVTHSNITGKYTFSDPSLNQVMIDLTYASTNENAKYLADHIGIPRNTSWTNTAGTVWESQKVADTFGTKRLYVLMPSGTTETTWENEFKGSGRGVIGTFQVTNNKYDIYHFFNSDPEGSRRVFRNPGRVPLNFKLVNDEGDIIDLNGLSWFIELNFQSVN